MKVKTFLLAFAMLLMASPLATEPDASAAGFLVHAGPGEEMLPLALPSPQALAGADDQTQQLWGVIRRDLEMSGYFTIIDPAAYVEKGKGVEPGTFDFADWRILNAAALAKTRIQPSADGYRADVYVYDVNGGAKIDAKGFVGKKSDVRYLGHKIADEILMALTGQPGIFGYRLAVVGSKTGHKEIYVMDMDGEGVASVTNNGTINLSPAWSPTGDRIAFTSYRRDNPDLYVKDLKTGTVRAISQKPGINTGAAFSPDGKKIALARSDGPDSDIWIIDAQTGADLQRLTKGNGIDVAPAWSPDGTKIAYTSERSGGTQVFVQDVASGTVNRVTLQGGYNTDPVFSPDGSKIAFVGRDVHFDVFVVDTDGHNLVRVTQDMGDNEDPSWSPDGRYLVFSSTRDGKSRIWLSTADGRNQVPITPSSGGWTQPSWGPK